MKTVTTRIFRNTLAEQADIYPCCLHAWCPMTIHFLLHRNNGYRLDLELLRKKLSEDFDLFIWVNPNSPTGLHVPKADVEAVLRESSGCRRVWIDETYVDYVGVEHSLETFAEISENVLVCKSLSKVYVLSGLRAVYLCASPHQLESLRSVKGLNSGSESVVTTDLVMTVQKPLGNEVANDGRALENGDKINLITEAIHELSENEARNPSHVYARVLRKAIQKHLVLDDLHLGDVLVSLRNAGYAIDRKTGSLYPA
jgi:aspartate/methionine/tyrosine aminotransferase